MYRPMTGRFGVPFVLVRGRGTGSIEKVAGIVKELERRAQVRPEPLAENFSRQMEPSRYGAALAGFIGLLALTMASIGMSGVFAYVVRQRMGEIGVRMAVGAQPWQVVRLVLASSMRALSIGLAIGLALAVAGGVALAHQLLGMKASDPVAVLLLLAVAAAIATVAPARRAARGTP